MEKYSNIGDLTNLAQDLEKVFKKHFGVRPAMTIAFTLGPKYDTAHWVTNVARMDGIKLMREAAGRMQSQLN